MLRFLPLLLCLTCTSLAAGCATEDDVAAGIRTGDIAFEAIVEDSSVPVGERSYTLGRMFKLTPDALGVFYCHVGTFDADSAAIEPVVLELAGVNAATYDPPAPRGVQFSETNGAFGALCVEIQPERAADLRACLDTESDCQSVRDASAGLPRLEDFVPLALCAAADDGSPVDCTQP